MFLLVGTWFTIYSWLLVPGSQIRKTKSLIVLTGCTHLHCFLVKMVDTGLSEDQLGRDESFGLGESSGKVLKPDGETGSGVEFDEQDIARIEKVYKSVYTMSRAYLSCHQLTSLIGRSTAASFQVI